jgi:hypothetical protein
VLSLTVSILNDITALYVYFAASPSRIKHLWEGLLIENGFELEVTCRAVFVLEVKL